MSDFVIMPELRFPEFNHEWEEKRLGDFMHFKNGVNADKSQYGYGRRFINVLDIIADKPIMHDQIIGCVDIPDKEFEKNEVIYGDVLFQRSSETREEAGQSNIYLDKDKSSTFGGFVIRGRPTVSFDPVYFDYLLKTSSARKEITTKSGGSTRFNVGQESLGSVVIQVSQDDDEQQKIAAFLGLVDNKLSKLRRKHELLETWKRGLMQKIFSQQLRFTQDDGRAFPDWERKSLGDVASVIGGGTPDTSVAEYWEGDIQWFTPSEIKKKYLFDSKRTITDSGLNHSSAKLLPIGTLLLSTRATVGDVGIATKECSTNQGFQSLVMKDDNKNEFWFYWIIKNKKELLRRSAGSTFLEIGKSEVVKIHVWRPCPEEQQKIADFLSSIDKKIEAVTNKITQTETFKKGLLQKMFV